MCWLWKEPPSVTRLAHLCLNLGLEAASAGRDTEPPGCNAKCLLEVLVVEFWLLLRWAPGLIEAVQNSPMACGGWVLALENVCLVHHY